MPDEHARLSASGAKRWMTCPKSVALEETLPEKDTEFSLEGTEAHALAEKLLTIFKKEGRKDFTAKELGDNRDMALAVTDYVEYIATIFDSMIMQSDDAVMYIEQRVDFSRYVPAGFGTCDCIIIAGNTLHIVDYKHGKGVRVYCKNNPQPRLYALGALEMFEWEYPIKWIKTHIVQPRIDWADSEALSTEFLREWGEDEVKPKAKLAWEDKGDFVPSDACQFCKAKPICKARASKSLSVIQNIIRRK